MHRQYELRSMLPFASNHVIFLSFGLRHKYMTGNPFVDIVIQTLITIIFNFSIQFIWLNATYIILNLCCKILWIYRDVGKTLFYHKWYLIWPFIFVCSVISDHDVISHFTVVVNYMSVVLYLLICAWFLWNFNSQSNACLIKIIISQ